MKTSLYKFAKILTLVFAGLSIALPLSPARLQAASALPRTGASGRSQAPKYIFFFIGDGMSISQVRMAEAALHAPGFKEQYAGATLRPLKQDKLYMSSMTATGMATTHAENRFITGSAAAATALATGQKTTINTISMNGDRTRNLETIAEMSKKKGMKVGIITSVSIDHATPACFYAHVQDRNYYEAIGEQLVKTGFDYFGGGTVRFNKYKNKTLEQFKQMAAAEGYTYVNTRKEFDALNAKSGKVIASIKMLDTYTGDGGALPYNIDLSTLPSADDRISLADFTKKGVELLYGKKGFFMMVEGGKIDWTCHANDAVSGVYETIAFDEAVGVAVDFYKAHPDETLIIVTGDHECGGLTLGYAATHYETAFNYLSCQNTSFIAFSDKVKSWRKIPDFGFEQALAALKESFGLGDAQKGLALSESETRRLHEAFDRSMKKEGTLSKEEAYLKYGSYDPFTVTATHILANRAGLNWASYSHTAVPVAVFATGRGSEVFNGYYDNTDIPKRIMKVARLNP